MVGDLLDEALEAAVQSLGDRFRTVLLRVDVERSSCAEAAEALGAPGGHRHVRSQPCS